MPRNEKYFLNQIYCILHLGLNSLNVEGYSIQDAYLSCQTLINYEWGITEFQKTIILQSWHGTLNNPNQAQFIFKSFNSQHNSILMRKRSGAMHCETQIEYMELASNVDTSSGLFYNNKDGNFRAKRRKYGMSLDKSSQNSHQMSEKQQSNQNSGNAFSGFDFDEQTHAFSQDYQELEMSQKYLSTRTNKNNFLILTKSNPNITLIELSKLRNIHTPSLFKQYMLESHPPIQLLMDKKVNQTYQTTFIDCYWIVDVLQIQGYRYLLDVYVSSSSKILFLFDDDLENLTSVQIGSSSRKGTLEEFIAAIDEEREIY